MLQVTQYTAVAFRDKDLQEEHEAVDEKNRRIRRSVQKEIFFNQHDDGRHEQGYERAGDSSEVYFKRSTN